MEENRLDNELERLYKKLPFLWKKYGFHVNYFTRDYGMYSRGFIIGLENDICRLVFERETNSSVEPISEYVEKILPIGTSKSFLYTLNALREKMIELVGDGWIKVKAVYGPGGMEFHFEY